MTTADPPAAPDADSARQSAPPIGALLLTLAGLLGPAALGAAVGFALLDRVLLDLVHLGDVQRIVELGRHLDEPAPSYWLPILGDSIVRDGIDAQVVQTAAASGWRVENLGVSGCSLTERQIIIPRILARRPAAVAIGLYATDLCLAGGLGLHEAHAYARAGFPGHWPDDWLPGDGADLGPERVAALRATGWRLSWRFRTVLQDWLEYQLRRAARRDVQAAQCRW